MILIMFPWLHNNITYIFCHLRESVIFFTTFVAIFLVVILFSLNKTACFFVMQSNWFQQNAPPAEFVWYCNWFRIFAV